MTTETFFEGRHFSIDLDRARTFARLYPIIISREWFIIFLTQIDMYCQDNVGYCVRKEDGTVKNYSNMITEWLKKETSKQESTPNQQPANTVSIPEQIKADEQYRKDNPEEFPDEAERLANIREIRSKLSRIGG